MSEIRSQRKFFWLISATVLFFILASLPAPEAVGQQGWYVICVGVLMLTLWVSEAIPIPVSAMLPIVLFPILDVMTIKSATASYAHPIVFLFMGGFVIALAMEKWKLHLRIALSILRLTGTHPNGIVAGFMIATAFLSMWMSNTATTVMMLPIAYSVLELLLKRDMTKGELSKGQLAFAVSLMIGVAYAANIGGTATLIGTPPNAILAGFMQDQYGYVIGFADWMMISIPFTLISLVICWFVLTVVIYPSRLGRLEQAADLIDEQYRELGPMTRGEKSVLVVFVTTAALWMFKGVLPFENVSDTGIAIAAAVALFLIPVNYKKEQFLLVWEDMQRLPWGILLLFGGGLSLAGAMQKSGLIELVGTHLADFSTLGIFGLVLVTTVFVLLMTEMMSNLALITIFLPVLAGMAMQLGENPLLFAIPATLASSCAFMLPMSTPPNAIVFASGYIKVFQMVRSGIVMNILTIMLIMLVSYTLLGYVFGVQHGVVPDWAILGISR